MRFLAKTGTALVLEGLTVDWEMLVAHLIITVADRTEIEHGLAQRFFQVLGREGLLGVRMFT